MASIFISAIDWRHPALVNAMASFDRQGRKDLHSCTHSIDHYTNDCVRRVISLWCRRPQSMCARRWRGILTMHRIQKPRYSRDSGNNWLNELDRQALHPVLHLQYDYRKAKVSTSWRDFLPCSSFPLRHAQPLFRLHTKASQVRIRSQRRVPRSKAGLDQVHWTHWTIWRMQSPQWQFLCRSSSTREAGKTAFDCLCAWM